MMSRTKKKVIVTLTIVIVSIALLIFSNPIRWPVSLIREYVLNITPLNTSFETVEASIKKRKWSVSYKDRGRGFYHQGVTPKRVIGSMSIQASLGDYQGIPFKANVTVFWGFDKESRLIDIWVWKTWDAI
jgi:hypothetical protein